MSTAICFTLVEKWDSVVWVAIKVNAIEWDVLWLSELEKKKEQKKKERDWRRIGWIDDITCKSVEICSKDMMI